MWLILLKKMDMSDLQNNEPVKYNAGGFTKFLDYFLDQLQAKKCIALFDKYEDAKTDVLLEMITKNMVWILLSMKLFFSMVNKLLFDLLTREKFLPVSTISTSTK